jgi:hypothetical protein
MRFHFQPMKAIFMIATHPALMATIVAIPKTLTAITLFLFDIFRLLLFPVSHQLSTF